MRLHQSFQSGVHAPDVCYYWCPALISQASRTSSVRPARSASLCLIFFSKPGVLATLPGHKADGKARGLTFSRSSSHQSLSGVGGWILELLYFSGEKILFYTVFP